jgi:hypothetical protein
MESLNSKINKPNNNQLNKFLTYIFFWSNLLISCYVIYDYNFFIGLSYLILDFLYVIDYIIFISDKK